MSYLDRIAVHHVEARRLAIDGSVSRGRLALLLLDNAAETLLRSSADTYLQRATFYKGLLSRVERADPHDDEGQALIQRFRPHTVSKARQKKIHGEFDALVDYVFEQEDWPPQSEMAACVKILHKFRNDAYHRDKVQGDVLGPAVVIYFYLVAHLLKHRKSMFHQIEPPPPGVRELLDGDPFEPTYPGLTARHFGKS